MEPFVQKQFDEYQANRTEKEILSKEELRELMIKDLSFVSTMGVAEYTLYQKYQEIHIKYPTQTVSTLFGEETNFVNEDHLKLINETKSNIWFPNSYEDFEKLEPELIYTDSNKDRQSAGTLTEKWNCLRTMTHSQKNSSNIGRNLHYIVRDKVTEKYLGVICITGDFIDLTPRDDYIGWDRVRKTQKMINHTCIGSTIVPIQPLGYNLVGGKLLALLCLSDTVEKTWEHQYKDKLVGVTTTSLYGKTKTIPLSQYDRLKHWKKMGWTAGSVSYEPEKTTNTMIQQWLMKNHTYKYFEWYVAKKPSGQPHKRDHRNRSRAFTYSKLGIDKKLQKSEHARGIYFGELFTNTREFLREETNTTGLTRAFDNSVEALTDLWKTKYARKRIASLKKQDRVSKETHFYDDIIYLTWEETKQKYLPQVGR